MRQWWIFKMTGEETMVEENNEEEHEVEVIEVELNNEEIDELMIKLNELKENKSSINFDLSDDIELISHYDEDEAK